MSYVSSIALEASLVPRPSPAPVFDRLQYAKTASDQKLEPGKGAIRGLRDFFSCEFIFPPSTHYLLMSTLPSFSVIKPLNLQRVSMSTRKLGTSAGEVGS